ncbi:MAG: hypothetical protein P8Z40_17970, partial [Chloroflexota bacterium]
MANRAAARPRTGTFIDQLAGWLNWWRFIYLLGLIIFLFMILFPFYWMVSSSFKTGAEIAGRTPVYIPSALRLDAYRELFDPAWDHFQNFGVNVLNSIKVAIPTAIIAVILASFGAYAIARLKFRGKELMLNSVLIVYLLPAVLLIIPLFAMLSQLSDRLGFNV